MREASRQRNRRNRKLGRKRRTNSVQVMGRKRRIRRNRVR